MIGQHSVQLRAQLCRPHAAQCCAGLREARSLSPGFVQDAWLMTTTLDHARRLLALAQSGLHFTHEEYDRERYREIVDIATAVLAAESSHSAQTLHQTGFVEDG
jgi:hypothetical protein